MKLPFTFLFCLLKFVCSHSGYLFDYGKIESFEPFSSFINYSHVTPECTKDMKTWISSIEQFTAASSDCLFFKNCTASILNILKDNIYAIQQYDAFAKIPSAGLLEVSLVFDGSYQECHRISGVKYETNYCYVLLVPGRNVSELYIRRIGIPDGNS